MHHTGVVVAFTALIMAAIYRNSDTGKWHLKNIYAKLGVSNRTEAVLLATAKDRRKHDA